MHPTLTLSAVSPQPVHLKTVEAVKPTLSESIDYALEGKGGGFRLKLGNEAGLSCGLSVNDSEQLAEGIEYFHHASLIFDDLPCMDDSEERRGCRCLHRVAGESKAILAALALVNRAYTQCWKVTAQYPEFAGRAAGVVERYVGELGILDGQDRDLSYRPELGAKEVKAIAAGKTGALLQLTLLLPAVLTGAGLSECLRLSRMARAWGIAYQGLDDFSDLLPSLAQSGKTPFRDLEQGRPNLVVAMGADAALTELRRYLCQAERQIEQLSEIDPKWAFLRKFHAALADKEIALRVALAAA